jgi:hypothetical protein
MTRRRIDLTDFEWDIIQLIGKHCSRELLAQRP